MDLIPKHSFTNLKDYSVQIGMYVSNRFADIAQQKNSYEESLKRIRLVEIPGFDNEYTGFLPVPGDQETRLDEGDALRISFDIDAMDGLKMWPAKVVSNIPNTPVSIITLNIRRPWDQESGWADDVPHDIISFRSLTDDKPYKTILSNKGIPCRVKIVASDSEEEKLQWTLEQMLTRPATTWIGNLQDNFLQLILANNLHSLGEYDLMKHLRSEFPNYLDDLELNEGQKRAHLKSQKALGAVQLIQGGPGTGKTHYTIETIKPHLKSQRHLQILHLSPSNVGVDDTAIKVDAILKDLQANGFAANKYVVRVHSMNTEQSILVRKAQLQRGKQAKSRPAALKELSEEDRTLLQDLTFASTLAEKHKKDSSTKYQLIHDERVNVLHLSLGYVMLQFVGLIEGGPKAADMTMFATFKNIYWRYSASTSKEDFSDEDMESFILHSNRLKSFIIKKAAVVFATVANGAEYMIQENVYETVKLIMIEEAARIPEHVVLPVLFGKYTNLSGVLMIGDPAQHKPTAMSRAKPEDNHMHQLLEQSLMTRLGKCGMHMEFFEEQHRMHPRILGIFNKWIYQNRLVSSPMTSQGSQGALVSEIEAYNKDKFGKATNVLLINIEEKQPFQRRTGGPNKTQTCNGLSRYNNYHVSFAINLIYELLKKFPNATIAYLTAYSAQLRLVLSAKDRMVAQDNDNLDIARRFVATTWSKAQGLEYDMSVISYLIMRNAGFQNSSHNLNVVHSRSKAGEWVITTKKDIDEIPRSQSKWISKFVSSLLPYRVIIPSQAQIPSCQFFEVGQIDMRTLEDLSSDSR